MQNVRRNQEAKPRTRLNERASNKESNFDGKTQRQKTYVKRCVSVRSMVSTTGTY
jgi:hypothetical protein